MSHNMLTSSAIRAYVESNPSLVTRKPVVRHLPHEWYVLKYRNLVFYRNLWTPELCEMRGTIVDGDYNIIARPPTKIFNYGERNTRIHRDEYCTFSQKVNGFMCCVTLHDGELLVSTTGSMDSAFADMARDWVEPFYGGFVRMGEGLSYTFEIVDTSDPHIVKESPGVYLLSVRATKWNTPNSIFSQAELDSVAARLGSADSTMTKSGGVYIRRPEHHRARFGDQMIALKHQRHEGFVAYGETSGVALKLKTPYYLATKFIGRMRDDRFGQLLDNPEKFKPRLDEEFYPIIDHLALNQEKFLSLDKYARIGYVRNYFDIMMTS